MRERDTVWIDLGDKSRPGVVIEARSDLVRVAYGTSREQPGAPSAVVHDYTRAGKKLPLRQTTMFYGSNTAWKRPVELRSGAAPCTRELFLQIRRPVEEHGARVEELDD